MKKALVKNCRYSANPITGAPLFCDVYVLLDAAGQLLVPESIFLADIAKCNSLETARGYASDLLSFAKMARGMGGWGAVTQYALTGYLHGELYQRRQYKQATMQRHIASCKKFFEWLELKGYTDSLGHFEWGYKHLYSNKPTDSVAYVAGQHSFHSLYIDEEFFSRRLLPCVQSKDLFVRRRDQIVLRLGYECGTRAHEVLQLDAKHVQKAIRIAREENKNLWATAKVAVMGKGSRTRDLLIPPQLCEFIWDYIVRYRNHINKCDGPLICKRDGSSLKDPKHASTVFYNAFRITRMDRHFNQGYHRLRKSFGTNICQECYDKGRDPWVLLPRLLGHKSIETTKLYIQFDALRNNRSHVLRDLKMLDKKFEALRE